MKFVSVTFALLLQQQKNHQDTCVTAVCGTFDPAQRAMPTDSFRFIPPERVRDSAEPFSTSFNDCFADLTSFIAFLQFNPLS